MCIYEGAKPVPARVVTAMFLLRKLSGKSYELTAQEYAGTSSTSSHAEDDGSKQVVDQASEHVREGNYEKALWMLERLGQLDPTVKGVAELVAVAEVSYAAVSRSCTCLSRENRNPDWYKILKVDEKSELSAIKKRYRHLALLLHPDKNKHVKAEAAFKLVSEAYACLSDKKKRANFNVKRSLLKCRRCRLKDCVSSESDRWYVFQEKKTGLQRTGSSPDLTQTDWILDQERLRIFRARARARVFGNLERVWKERGFTGTEEVTVGKEMFCERKVKQATMTSDQHQCKKNINKTNKKRTSPESSPMTMNNEISKGSMGDMNHAMKVSHQQLSKPYKSLGVLIRDLQTELVSSIESTGDQKYQREDVLEQSPTRENVLETDSRDLGSHVQEGAETLSTMLGPHAEGDSTQHLSGSLRACLQNHATNAVQKTFCTPGNSRSVPSAHSDSYPDGVLNDSSSTSKDDAHSASDIASKSCSNKGYSLCEKRRESFINLEKVESDSLIECERQRKNKEEDCSRTARKDVECASTILKTPNLCRRIGRGDSLDLEETILQTQKEKSEQLLKTLQRLREETKTVAASLDHFCSRGSY